MSWGTDRIRGLSRKQLAARIAEDIPEGWYINLGIGMPTEVANCMPTGREVVIHSENGILGLGPAPNAGDEDHDLINAGKQPATLRPGGTYVSHTDSFAIVRGGHLDLTIMGAYEVGQNGDLANWSIAADGENAPAVGGAMDLAVGAQRVWVVTTHTTASGEPKLVSSCSLPLTAPCVVNRVYTNLAVIDIQNSCFVLREASAGWTSEAIQERTGASLILPTA